MTTIKRMWGNGCLRLLWARLIGKTTIKVMAIPEEWTDEQIVDAGYGHILDYNNAGD